MPADARTRAAAVLVSSSNNCGNGLGGTRKFYGDKGGLILDNWSSPTYTAKGAPRRDGRIRSKNLVPEIQRPDHFLDWLQCIRSGRTPHTPIEAGFQHAVAVLMAITACDTGHRTVYDPQRRTIQVV